MLESIECPFFSNKSSCTGQMSKPLTLDLIDTSSNFFQNLFSIFVLHKNERNESNRKNVDCKFGSIHFLYTIDELALDSSYGFCEERSNIFIRSKVIGVDYTFQSVFHTLPF